MADVASIEHVFERVQLVGGKGDRRTGQLCIMSFVALLAGEDHTDTPMTASPFISDYATTINYGMPDEERHRLKLFAARIVGTNDGQDVERSHIMLSWFAEEIVPHLQACVIAGWRPIPLTDELAAYGPGDAKSVQDFALAFVADARRCVATPEMRQLATVVAVLLIVCARSAPLLTDAHWYWSKAIDLLDRLCDVGPQAPRSAVCPTQVENTVITYVRAGRPAVIYSKLGKIVLSAYRKLNKRLTVRGVCSETCREASAEHGFRRRSSRGTIARTSLVYINAHLWFHFS
jgi:hypothetical protein